MVINLSRFFITCRNKKKLEEYQQVDEIDDVKIGTHLRYFTFNPSTGKTI